MNQQYTGKFSIDICAQPTTGSFQTATDATFHSQDGHQWKEPVCVFCKGAHKVNKCNVTTDLKERPAIVRWDGLCFNCLAQHKASCCSSKFTRRECKKRHHTSLYQSFPTERSHHRTCLTNQLPISNRDSSQWHQLTFQQLTPVSAY